MSCQIFINNKKIIPAGLMLTFLFVSCRLDLPIKEMTLAKSNITRAEEVRSGKYAPEELKKAKDELYKSHDNMKADDVKTAKKAAEESLKYSNEAIARSLPLLADDVLKEARGIYEEADMAFAERYASEEFGLAGGKIKEAESLLAGKEYWESYLKSMEAISHAGRARDKALSNISALKDMIKRIGNEEKKLESMGARDFAADDMKAIDADLGDATLLLEKKNVKEATAKIAEADSALKLAGLKTWKGVAAARIKAAEDAMQKLEASPSKASFADGLEKAGGLIKEGKDLFDKEAFSESVAKTEEALAMLNSISLAMEKETEIRRIEKESKTEATKYEESETTPATDYVVKYNPKNRDCLWRIAMFTYKDARLWPLIYMANKDKIKDPDLIFPGQKLIIPAIPKRSEIKESKSGANVKTEEQLSQEEIPAGSDSSK